MVRVRVVGGRYHKNAFSQMNENSVIELVHESTNPMNSNATMVLADRNHVGYISEKGGSNCMGNDEFRKRFNNNVENLKCVLHKKYTNVAYLEVIDMNVYSFEIHKMTDEQIRELGQQASLSILSAKTKWCDLAFGGVSHQPAYQDGVKPHIGEKCHLERKWRGKGGKKESHYDAGDKGTVHLVSDETGYSYGVLMQSEKKIQQLRDLGFQQVWNTNQNVRNDNFFFNPYTTYEIRQIIDGKFIFVDRIGPDEFELITGRHSYARVY